MKRSTELNRIIKLAIRRRGTAVERLERAQIRRDDIACDRLYMAIACNDMIIDSATAELKRIDLAKMFAVAN